MKAVLFEMAPMHFRTLRLFFGAAGLFTIARMSGQPIRIPKGQWPQTIAIALVNTMGWNIFAVYGVQLMASGRAAILGYTMPVRSVFIATWLTPYWQDYAVLALVVTSLAAVLMPVPTKSIVAFRE